LIERHENVLIYGQTGTGKSHLSQALAHDGWFKSRARNAECYTAPETYWIALK